MKIRPLPETDLARVAPLQRDQKRRALEQIHLGRPPYSYAPTRGSLSDVLNVQSDLIGSMPRTPWEKISQVILRKSRSDAEAEANLRVARGLFNFVDEKGVVGRHHDIYPLQLSLGTKVVFWQPTILRFGDQPVIPFLDLRRAKRLTADGRRFVFSVMHERIRAADPDFADVTLAVLQFKLSAEGPREPTIFTDRGVELYSFDDLDRMVRETYELWTEISQERTADTRRRGAGGGGFFP